MLTIMRKVLKTGGIKNLKNAERKWLFLAAYFVWIFP